MEADLEGLALRHADGRERCQLDQQDEAEDAQHARHQDAEVRNDELAQPPSAGDRRVLGDDADKPTGRVHHHDDEQHADIEQPGVAEQADAALQQDDDDGPQQRPEEAAGAADIGRQQRGGRLGRRHRVERHDLVDNGIEPAADAGEEAGQCELVEAHHARVVADKLGALEIVARRVGHPAERRLGLQSHRHGGDRRPDHDEAINLPRRAVGDAHHAGTGHAVGADAAFAAEEGHEHQGTGRHELAQAHGDHGEGGGALLGGDVAEQRAEDEPAQAAGQRHQLDRQPHRARLDGIQRMRRDVAAQPEQDGMAERQQARLPHLHVEGQREHRHQADLAQHGEHEAGMAMGRPVEEQPRQQQGRHHRGPPQPVPAQQGRQAGSSERSARGLGAHVSRVPIRPRGLNIRISTSST